MATQLDQNNLQNNNQQTQIDPSQQQQQQQTGGGEASSTGGGGGTVANNTPQRQGSGRYNNLQKYINANQGAGQRLYQGIGQQLNRETSGTEKQASTQSQQIAENVQASRDTLNRGQNYQNQMQDQNFNAQNFVNNQDQLTDFAKFKAGQNVDETQLQQQNQSLQDIVQSGQNLVNQRAQQAQTEEGRFNLLQNTFGGRGLARPQYSQGQQRLDQLFLQAGEGNNVQNLQNVVQQKANVLQGLQGQASQFATNINDVASQERLLGQNLQNVANTKEQSMLDALQAKIGDVNAQRELERQRGQTYVDTLTGKTTTGGSLFGTNKDLSDMLGLQQNQQVFDAMKNVGGVTDVFNVSQRNAQNIQDVANQQDVNVYDALAKLRYGNANQSGQFQFDPTQKKLSQASDLENVLSARNDDMSLQNRIKQAKDAAMKTFAGNRILSWVPGNFNAGMGGQYGSYDPGLYGQNAQVDAWLDGRRNKDNTKLGWEGLYGQIHPESLSQSESRFNIAQAEQDIGQQFGNQKDQFGAPIYSQEQLRGMVQNKYQDWAKQQIESSFEEKMRSFLDSNNFFNYLSDSGVKKGDQDIANYGYGTTPAAGTTKGIYKAPGQVNIDDIMGGADLTMSPEERMRR